MLNNNQTKPTKDELIRMELNKSINSGVKSSMTQRLIINTEQGSLLNNKLIRRKEKTLNMVKVPVAYFKQETRGGKYFKKIKFIKLAESRLTRFFESNLVCETKTQTIPLNNGQIVETNAEYTYYELKDYPILFVEFIAEPTFADLMQAAAYEECKEIITKGLRWKFKDEFYDTEYTQGSASEMRALKGLFVRKDTKFSEKYLSGFKPANNSPEELEEFEKFMDIMRSLRGAEVIYTAISYGAYLQSYKGVDTSPSKFMARMGAGQTSTKSMGNDFNVKCIGDIKFHWTEEIEREYKDYYTNLVDEKGNPLYSEKRVASTVLSIYRKWKEEKADGQNIIRASAVIRGFKKLNIKLKAEQVIGKLIQFRWAGVKGTALCVPDSYMENPTLPDGTHPYVDYDIIIEKASWKYSPWIKYWTGDRAPELELVAISKSKYSNNMTYQGQLALDGDSTSIVKLRDLVDARCMYYKESMLNAEIAKAVLGVKSTGEEDIDDILDIDDFERSLTTVLAKALEACDDIIYDRSWRIKFTNRTTKMRDKMGYGKLPVEGANRFIISDPTGFFRTDLAVPRLNKDGTPELDYEGNPMFDIIITSMKQMAIQSTNGVYWDNNEKEAVLFRSPCVHPGEPQRVNLVGLESIPEVVETAYGKLDIRELFTTCKDLVVINCFGFILDALGGADTDGDTVLIVTEPTIVSLRSLRRAPMLIDIGSETFHTIITPESIKQYMVDSLKDSGIGRITNWATTWRDIELMIVHMPNPINGKYRLPSNVKEALVNVVKKAKIVLQNDKDMPEGDKRKLNEIELASVRQVALIADVNDDSKYSTWAKIVINACEANLVLTRFLQETSINTAKSGVFVDFKRYPWLSLKADSNKEVRASWHRPNSEEKYESWSTMGQLSSYVKDKWDELRTWAGETSKPLTIGTDLDWASYRETYKSIRELKASYGTAMYTLNHKGKENVDEDVVADDKQRMKEYKELGIYYNCILRRIAVEIGSIDAVSAMVYRATNDRDKDNDEGLSFVWQCWGEEFVQTLKHMNSGSASRRLVIVNMAKEYVSYTLTPGEYIVAEGKVYLPQFPEKVIAYSKVPDGNYEIIVIDETPYLLFNVVKKTVESMAANFKGTKLKLIGFKYHEYDGKTITRDCIKKLLSESDYTITVAGGECPSKDGKIFLNALVTVTPTGSEEPICIGNIPSGGAKNDESGYFAQALHDKVIRVIIPKDSDKLDIKKDGTFGSLTLEIVEITKDLAL